MRAERVLVKTLNRLCYENPFEVQADNNIVVFWVCPGL